MAILMLEDTRMEDAASLIRLLRIVSAPEYGLLIAEQQSFLIEAAPAYAAISYTWGSAKDEVTILLNDQEIKVRHNARYALWQSFLHNSELMVWIDSICIDQQNIREKSVQVGMMGEIFRRAHFVFASIGPHENDSEFVCAAIANFELRSSGEDWDVVVAGKPRYWHAWRLPEHWVPWKYTQPQTMYWSKHLKAFGHLARLRKAAEDFIKRPYWHRLWILQEVSLARRVFVMCGADLLLWSSTFCFFETLNYFPKDGYEITCKIFYSVEKCGYSKPKRPLDSGLEDIVDHITTLECSDPRDRIFGTLSLVHWLDHHVMPAPDYRLTVREIIEKTVSHSNRSGCGTTHNSIYIASILVRIFRMTREDLILLLDQHRIPETPESSDYCSTSDHETLVRAMEDSVREGLCIPLYLTLPAFCELAWSHDMTHFTMNEKYGVFRAKTPSVFGDIVANEMMMRPGRPRFQQLALGGQLAGLICLAARPGDVLRAVSITGHKMNEADLILYLVFRPMSDKKFYAVVGYAIAGRGELPHSETYEPDKSQPGCLLVPFRDGKCYLAPRDIIAHAARKTIFGQNLQLNPAEAMTAILADNFVSDARSSFFISDPTPDRRNWMDERWSDPTLTRGWDLSWIHGWDGRPA